MSRTSAAIVSKRVRSSLVAHPLVAGGGDRGHRRVDAAQRIGTARGGVGVGGHPQRLHAQLHRGVPAHRRLVAHLDDGARVEAAGAGGHLLLLLVAAAGHVVAEQPALAPTLVVAGEDRHDDHPLHGGREVAPDHHAELVGLALQAQRDALDLLVVLQLQLEQLHHLHGRAGGAGDGDAAVAVGREHLLHRAAADEVARGGPPVTGHDDAVRVGERDARRGVRDVQVASALDAAEAGGGTGRRGAAGRRSWTRGRQRTNGAWT